MKLTTSIKFALILLAFVALGALYIIKTASAPLALASVPLANEYFATSTAANGFYGAQTTGTLIKAGQGSVGSVIITGANTGVINLYNATTSNINLRTGNVSSSTILIASFPANTVAGTYTIDAVFTNGLLLDLPIGAMPTTTITWR